MLFFLTLVVLLFSFTNGMAMGRMRYMDGNHKYYNQLYIPYLRQFAGCEIPGIYTINRLLLLENREIYERRAESWSDKFTTTTSSAMPTPDKCTCDSDNSLPYPTTGSFPKANFYRRMRYFEEFFPYYEGYIPYIRHRIGCPAIARINTINHIIYDENLSIYERHLQAWAIRNKTPYPMPQPQKCTCETETSDVSETTYPDIGFAPFDIGFIPTDDKPSSSSIGHMPHQFGSYKPVGGKTTTSAPIFTSNKMPEPENITDSTSFEPPKNTNDNAKMPRISQPFGWKSMLNM